MQRRHAGRSPEHYRIRSVFALGHPNKPIPDLSTLAFCLRHALQAATAEIRLATRAYSAGGGEVEAGSRPGKRVRKGRSLPGAARSSMAII